MGWDLVASDTALSTSITCNTESGDFVFREETINGKPIRNLSASEAAEELRNGFTMTSPAYEDVMAYLSERGLA